MSFKPGKGYEKWLKVERKLISFPSFLSQSDCTHILSQLWQFHFKTCWASAERYTCNRMSSINILSLIFNNLAIGDKKVSIIWLNGQFQEKKCTQKLISFPGCLRSHGHCTGRQAGVVMKLSSVVQPPKLTPTCVWVVCGPALLSSH